MATPIHETESKEQPTAPMLKGSWEELLQRAQQLAANRDDEAIAIYDKLISRLVKMPKDARMVNDQRLQNVLMQAGVNAQAYLSSAERYDDAINVMDQLLLATDDEAHPSINAHKADILIMAERVDEAAAIWRGYADENPEEMTELSQLMLVYVKAGQLDKATVVLDEFEAVIQKRSTKPIKADHLSDDVTDETTEEIEMMRARDEGYIYSMRSLLAMESGDWAKAVEWYEKSAATSVFYKENGQQVYARLVNNRQDELARPLIERDTKTVIGPAFWTGLVHHHSGNEEKATEFWTKAVNTEFGEEEARNFFEMIMSFYYMGDEERLGLELTLRLISESRNPNWSIFFLAGVGQAIHKDMNAAHTNMATAVQQSRVVAEGTHLNPDLRMFIEDLFDEETQAEFEKYLKPRA